MLRPRTCWMLALALIISADAWAQGRLELGPDQRIDEAAEWGRLDTREALTLEASAPEAPLSLWYRQPAREWVEALPLGNGRLGAMVFGRPAEERIQLNEDTLWSGGPHVPANPGAPAALPKVRQLIFAGEYQEAQALAERTMMAQPPQEASYQTLGDLTLNFPGHEHVRDYRRDLDLDTAVATTRYTVDGVRYTRRVFVSPVDQVVVVRVTADRPGSLTFTAGLSTPQEAEITIEDGRTLVMAGANGGRNGIPGALRFQARVRAIADGGQVSTNAGELRIAGADAATLLISAATSFISPQDVTGDAAARASQTLAGASAKPFDQLLADHLVEHRRLFRRVSIDLGETATKIAQQPTDVRIKQFKEVDDPDLAELYFQFGRYLLMSSSRPGTQPANLQGIWNESMSPPWSGNYTLNINTEMNYWIAEVGNLSECHEPLIRMVNELAVAGAHTARIHYGYGADGWVVHHNTTLWRESAPYDSAYHGLWPTGGAWLCQHLWEHYIYTGDEQYLASVYPTLKGSAEFFLDALVEHPQHRWLVTVPSMSPENAHHAGVSTAAGPTMDMQLLRDLFDKTAQAAEILGVDSEFRQQLAEARSRLAPHQVGQHGQLQEWIDDWDDPDNKHRHVSHLYGLFPSDQINPIDDPELTAAARKSLEMRGDGGTGWAKAWKINWWARLQEGDRAYKLFSDLIANNTYPNLFDAHPPFQIDGNFGAAAGLAHMILQACSEELILLPALPRAFYSGSVEGLRAPGGFELGVHWHGGRLEGATIRSDLGKPCRLRYQGRTVEFHTEAGRTYRLDAELNVTPVE